MTPIPVQSAYIDFPEIHRNKLETLQNGKISGLPTLNFKSTSHFFRQNDS